MKKPWLLLSVSLLLNGCVSDFFYGKSNFPEPQPLQQAAAQTVGKVAWQHSWGKEQSALQLALKPAYENGEVFAVSADGRLRSFDAQTGAVRLERDLRNTITAGVSVSQGVLLLGTANGSLLALDAQTGLPVWQALLSSQLLAAPAVGDGMTVVRTLDGQISAFDVRTGELFWRYRSTVPALSMRGQSAPVIAGGVVLVVTDGGRLLVLDQDNGVPLLEERVAIGKGKNRAQRMVDMDTQPQLFQNVLFASAYQNGMMAFDVAGAKMLWRQDLASALRDFALIDGEVLVFSDDKSHVYGLSMRDGRPLWHVVELEGRKLSSSVAFGRGRVAMLDFEGYLHVFDAYGGSALGHQKIANGGTSSAPIYVGERVIWQLSDGRLIAIDP